MSTKRLANVSAIASVVVLGYLGWLDGSTIYYDHNATVRVYAGGNFVIVSVAVLGALALGRLGGRTNRIVLDSNKQLLTSLEKQADLLILHYRTEKRLLDVVAESGRGDLVKRALDIIFEGERDGQQETEDATPGEPADSGNGGRAKGSHARGSRRRQGSGEDSALSGDLLPRGGAAAPDGGPDSD